MSEVIKDSAIKLFGRTISLPRNNEVSANDPSEHAQDCSHHNNHPPSPSFPREVCSTTEHEAEMDKEQLTSRQDQTPEEPKSPTSSGNLDNPKTPSTERETSLVKSSKSGEQSDTTSLSHDKAPKKPDKVLPCPRCNSMDTKFCYYNNYNVNQPRHFCKHCQRYWTAGGTMRNVPVGAGRRKNKSSPSSASHYRQIMLPETLQNGSLHSSAVLTFGSDSPLCDSMTSVLSLADHKSQNGVLNGFYAPKHNTNPNGDDVDNSNSVGGSIMASSLCDNATTAHEESVDNKSYQGFTPWPYSWNPSGFCNPVSFWGCMPMPVPPPFWGVQSSAPSSSTPNSPTLGKHSRDGDILFQKPVTENNNSVLIPKTLRIDDPTEAAKSSIWSTLGINNDSLNNHSLNGGGLFKAFASKGDDKNKNHGMLLETSPVLQANPAALSRSLVFHERT